MANTKNKTKEAPIVSLDEAKKIIAENEAAEMKQHSEDFKKWLEERNLTISVRSTIQDNQAKHYIALVRR